MGLLSWLGLQGDCEEEPIALDDQHFDEELVRSETPVLVDVWSNGCQPCAMLAPTIRRLACKYHGRLKVAHLNANKAPRTVARLGIRGTPTLLFFDRGREVERVVGVRGQHYFEEIIETELLQQSEPN